MKRKSLILIFITLMMLCLSMFAIVGCSEKPATLETVTITNKTELAAEWHIGDADRAVAVAFAPDSFTADNTSVVLTSDNRDAVVADGMVLKAVGLGKAKITATADGKTDTVDVEVLPKLTGIAITNKNVLTSVWYIGDDARMVEVKLSPDDFTLENTDVQITSSNPQVIKAEGKTLTALAEGTSTITAKAGEFSDTVDVTVSVSVSELMGISINEADLKKPWTVGDADREVVVTYDPASIYNNENTPYTITSDNTSAVTVIENKKIHAVACGEAKITVVAGNKTAEVTINVRPVLESISISNKAALKAKWAVGDATRTLNINYTPHGYYNDDNTTVTVSSSNTSAITVSGKTLTAAGVGTSTITVTYGTGENALTDSVEITVVPALKSLSITSEKTLNWTLDGSNSATISVSFDPEEYYSAVDVTVTASGDDIVTTDGLTITANGNVGTATITVAYKDDATIKDTITVTTTVSNPSIELSGNGVTLIQDGDKQGQYQLNGLHGATISLPTVNKAACDNRDDNIILDDLVLSDTEKMALDNNELTVSEKGEFTVTYTVKDSRDETKTATVTLNISIFRKVLADNDNYSMKEGCAFVEDDKQVVVGSNTGISFVPFNVQPSKNYYAEVTFDSKYFLSADGGWWDSGIGMGHFLPNESGRLLMSYVDKAKTHKVKDFNTTVNWETDETKDASIIYSYKLDEFRGIVFNTADDNTPNTVKYAIARIGDDFFCFVNDVYVCSVSPELYRNSDTIPGIFAVAMKNDNGNTEATKISYVFDAEAKTKVSSLLKGGSGVASAYVPNEYYLGSKAEGNFTVNVATDERGANFDVNGDKDNKKDYNSSCVSPYVYFDGDFALEWEYKPTWTSHEFGTGNTGSIFELRSINYWSELNKFGVRFFWDGSTPVVQFIAHRPQEEQFGWANESKKYAQSSTEYQNLMNYGVKMRVTRKITDGKATITYTVIPFIDANKTEGQVLFEVTQADIDQSNFGNNYQIATEVLQCVWHNMETAGEYSNIRWAHTATPDWYAPVVD